VGKGRGGEEVKGNEGEEGEAGWSAGEKEGRREDLRGGKRGEGGEEWEKGLEKEEGWRWEAE